MINKVNFQIVPTDRLRVETEKPLIIPEASRVQIETGQELGVSVIDARHDADGPTFIVSLGFNASVEEFEIQKHAVMAEQLGARLIMIDTPGFGENSSSLQDGQAKDLLKGRFDSCAEAVLKAAILAGHLEEGEEIGLIGYSMGSSMIASMAKVLNEKHDDYNNLLLHSVNMIEPVADHKQFSPWLSVKMGAENARNDGYFAENTELLDENGQPWAVLSHDRRVAGDPEALKAYKAWTAAHQKALLLSGAALGGGHIGEDLDKALQGSNDTTRLGEGSITSTLAGESVMTSGIRHAPILGRLGMQMTATGEVVLIERSTDGHAFPLSFSRAGSAASYIKRSIN